MIVVIAMVVAVIMLHFDMREMTVMIMIMIMMRVGDLGHVGNLWGHLLPLSSAPSS